MQIKTRMKHIIKISLKFRIAKSQDLSHLMRFFHVLSNNSLEPFLQYFISFAIQ